MPLEISKPRVIDRGTALLELSKEANWVVRDNQIEWLDENIEQPSLDIIDAKVAELSAAEPMRLLRVYRDTLLAETDWWVMPDRTPTQEQLDYRQALRDITETYSSLDDVVWPVKP